LRIYEAKIKYRGELRIALPIYINDLAKSQDPKTLKSINYTIVDTLLSAHHNQFP